MHGAVYQFGEHKIKVVETRRKGSFALKVTPACLSLLVPKRTSKKAVEQFLVAQRTWLDSVIAKRLSALSVQTQADADCVQVRFLGQMYPLKMVLGSASVAQHQRVRWVDEAFEVVLNPTEWAEKQPGLVKKHLLKWLFDWLQAYVAEFLPQLASQIGVRPSQFSIKQYKSRWGSCYVDGRLQFNGRLAMAPTWVIDYVMVHELCHLVHANHSPEYWRLVAHHYPRFREAKKWLNQYGASLIYF